MFAISVEAPPEVWRLLQKIHLPAPSGYAPSLTCGVPPPPPPSAAAHAGLPPDMRSTPFHTCQQPELVAMKDEPMPTAMMR